MGSPIPSPTMAASVTLPAIPVTINYFTADEEENVIDWFSSFQFAANALGWQPNDMFRYVPAYLQGTARRWYNAISNSPDKPTDYSSLKNKMIQDLCPADYRSYLSQELYKSKQKIGQSAIAFIYEIQELCLRIHEETPEILIVSMIKEKLLPQIKYGIALQNPKTMIELVEAARKAERAMYSCMTPFDIPNNNVH